MDFLFWLPNVLSFLPNQWMVMISEHEKTTCILSCKYIRIFLYFSRLWISNLLKVVQGKLTKTHKVGDGCTKEPMGLFLQDRKNMTRLCPKCCEYMPIEWREFFLSSFIYTENLFMFITMFWPHLLDKHLYWVLYYRCNRKFFG